MNTEEGPYIPFNNHWFALRHELEWLQCVLQERDDLFRQGSMSFNFDSMLEKVVPQPIDPLDYPFSPYTLLLEDMFAHSLETPFARGKDISEGTKRFIQYAERIVLLLAMAPCLRPELLDCFRLKDDLGRVMVEFGGNSTDKFEGFLPTGETASHILAGRDLKKRALLQTIIHPKHYLFEQGILFLSPIQDTEPPLSSQLVLSPKYIDILVRGQYEFLFDGTNLDDIDDDEANPSDS